MPNGYTSGIHYGKPGADSARAYLWQCVRGFGVCIEQRDDSLNAPIKLPEPPSYHTKALAEAEAELAEVQARTDEEWQVLYDDTMAKAKVDYQKSLEEVAAINARYDKVENEILAMEFDPIFANLRKSALEWIEQSRPTDSGYYADKASISFEDWKAQKLEHANWSVEYHRRERDHEIQAYNERKEYLQKLLALLGPPPQGLK